LTDFNKSYPNESKIAYYKSQINAYIYYSTTLPNRINAFVKKKCFDDLNSNKLTTEIQQMSRLDGKYSTKSKFTIIKKNSNRQLEEYRSKSYEEYGPCGEINL
jgi:hypothetical protein